MPKQMQPLITNKGELQQRKALERLLEKLLGLKSSFTCVKLLLNHAALIVALLKRTHYSGCWGCNL